MIRLVFIFQAIAWLSSAFASGLVRNSTVRFYSSVIGCGEISLPCLESAGLVRHEKGNLYELTDSGHRQNHEQESAARFAEALDLPILLVSDLPGFKGVPAIDAVIFSREGRPIANLGIKTFLGKTTKGIDSARSYLANSRASIRDHFSMEYILQQYGFTLGDQGNIVPIKGTPDQSYRRTLLDGTFKLLGIDSNRVRSVWIGLDFSNDRFKSLEIRQSTFDQTAFQGLGFIDSRVPQVKSRLVNLDVLQNRANNDGVVKKYIFLLNDNSVVVDPAGFSVKGATSDCASVLTKKAADLDLLENGISTGGEGGI